MRYALFGMVTPCKQALAGRVTFERPEVFLWKLIKECPYLSERLDFQQSVFYFYLSLQLLFTLLRGKNYVQYR